MCDWKDSMLGVLRVNAFAVPSFAMIHLADLRDIVAIALGVVSIIATIWTLRLNIKQARKKGQTGRSTKTPSQPETKSSPDSD